MSSLGKPRGQNPCSLDLWLQDAHLHISRQGTFLLTEITGGCWERLAVWFSEGVEEGNQNHTLPTLTCLIFRETNGTIPKP